MQTGLFFCLSLVLYLWHTALYAQQPDSLPRPSLSGKWVGSITQEGEGDIVAPRYYFELNLAQAGVVLSGSSFSFTQNKTGKYRLKCSLYGNIVGDTIELTEKDKLFYENTIMRKGDFCIKKSVLRLSQDKGKWHLAGKWTGYNHKTGTICLNGTIELVKYDPPVKAAELSFDEETPAMLSQRAVSSGKTITVRSDKLHIEIYDDGDIDGDIISLWHNDHWVLQKYQLRETPKRMTIYIDKKSPFNYLISYAHNLGKIKPNTAAFLIDDGVKKQRVVLNSDMDTCDVVYVVYEGDE